LRLKAVAVEGFNAQQVWEQVSRITEAVNMEVQRSLDNLNGVKRSPSPTPEEKGDDQEEQRLVDDLDEEVDGDKDIDTGLESQITDGEEAIDADEEDIIMEEGSDASNPESEDQGWNQNSSARDKFGLNDEFFSIDAFNRRTEMLEQQDALGEPDADAATDEEDID
jgi:U3 small nucleolar RNA-associated protein MPP10